MLSFFGHVTTLNTLGGVGVASEQQIIYVSFLCHLARSKWRHLKKTSVKNSFWRSVLLLILPNPLFGGLRASKSQPETKAFKIIRETSTC